MEDLASCGLLPVKTTTEEWLLPKGHDPSTPPDGYVVSFVPFHE
jgi:hypothetical protein